MCNFKKFRTSKPTIDKCMIPLLAVLKAYTPYKVIACCCGHKKYPMTIVYENGKGNIWELISDIKMTRTKRFYRRDAEGYYYIPETIVEVLE